MKKYTTKPIDFTGCHQVIAEALKRGKSIECFVYDSIRGIVLNKNLDGFYYVGIYGEYDDAIPIPKKQEVKYRLLPPEEASPLLIMRGWKFDNYGTLRKAGNPVLRDSTKEAGYYPSCILEEVQDDGDW